MQLLSHPGNSEEHSVTFSHQHPESYLRLKKELQSAQLAYKSPKDVWPSLFTELGQASALSVVIDFFIGAYARETDFYVKLLRCYVEDGDEVQADDLDRLSSHQVVDKPSMDDRISSLKQEIGGRLREVAQDFSRQCVFNDKAERLCKATAVLVSNDILALEDLWPYMGNSDHFSQSEAIYNGLVDARIAELQNVFAHETRDVYGDTDFVFSVMSEEENGKNMFDIKLDQPCSLHIWILLYLWKEGETNMVLNIIDTYKGLALVHEPLRTSLMTYLWRGLDHTHVSSETLLRILSFAADNLGPHFGQNFAFFEKACRHCADLAFSDTSPVLEALHRGILPALSLYRGKEHAANAVWSCIDRIGYKDRIWLYKKWQSQYEDIPVLRLVKTITEHDVKSLMRVITDEVMCNGFANLETIEMIQTSCRVFEVGRSIGYLAMTNPLIVWKQVLECIYEADNLVPLVENILPHRNDLAQDVLGFIILDELKESKRPRFKKDGVSYEKRFVSVSMVTALLFKEGFVSQEYWVLEYLDMLAEFSKTRPTELLPLSNLLTCMCGIKPINEFSNAQIEALGGSKHLIRELLSPTGDLTMSELCWGTSSFEDGEYKAKKVLLPESLASIESFCELIRGTDFTEKILTSMLKNHCLADVPCLWRSRTMDYQDRSMLVLRQFLLVLKLGAVGFPDILPKGNISSFKHWRSYSTSFAKYMDVGRFFLRSQLDSRSLGFVDDFRDARGTSDVDLHVFALFWTLEMYDLYVPRSSYLREIERISALNADRKDLDREIERIFALNADTKDLDRHEDGTKYLSRFITERERIIESLKSSYEEHVAHVAWALENLPIFKNDEPRSYWPWSILREMIIPRAARSKSDARYVFFFLSYTLAEPFSILEELFKTDMLLGEIKELSDLEMDGFAHFLKEIWQDLCHWPSLEAGDLQRLALCKGIREKVTRTLGDTRRGDVQGNVRADDRAVPGTDAGVRYSLFRPHKARKMDKDMQIWSEHLFKALITSLNSHDVEKRNKALILARGVPDVVLFTPKGRTLVDEWLPRLSNRFTENPRSAKLAEDVISVYNEHQMSGGVRESNAGCASRHEQETRRICDGEADDVRGKENVDESDNGDNADIVAASRCQKRTTEQDCHGSKRACIEA